MLKNFFGKKADKVDKEIIVAPVTGKLVEITQVPDPTFSEKMMGDGIAIIPTKGEFVAPVNGEIVNLFPTKHAIGIKSEAGVEYLLHIGLETVTLEGEGFEAHVKEGDKVSAGDLLITVDLALIEEKAQTITPLVIISDVASIDHMADQDVVQGETEIMTVHL